MDEPMLRAWMTESVQPAPYHEDLPGRWIAEPSWPPPNVTTHRLFLTDDGLQADAARLTPPTMCSPQTLGKHGGSWCPFGRAADQADDQQEDDARSLLFDTSPLDARIEILGAPIVTLDIAADKPLANLVVRLCDVRPDAASLRISYGILNLAYRDGYETPAPLLPGHRYRVRIKLNDAGAAIPAGHSIRLALSTTYWPMIWPPPENATITVFGGSLDLPVRTPSAEDALLPALPGVETAAPDPTTNVRPGVVRIDRLGLELGSDFNFNSHIDEHDPLSAFVEMRQSQTISRDAWRIAVTTQMRLSCTSDAFLLRATMRACEGGEEICNRTWETSVPRRSL
jgi:hypothetical protein